MKYLSISSASTAICPVLLTVICSLISFSPLLLFWLSLFWGYGVHTSVAHAVKGNLIRWLDMFMIRFDMPDLKAKYGINKWNNDIRQIEKAKTTGETKSIANPDTKHAVELFKSINDMLKAGSPEVKKSIPLRSNASQVHKNFANINVLNGLLGRK